MYCCVYQHSIVAFICTVLLRLSTQYWRVSQHSIVAFMNTVLLRLSIINTVLLCLATQYTVLLRLWTQYGFIVWAWTNLSLYIDDAWCWASNVDVDAEPHQYKKLDLPPLPPVEITRELRRSMFFLFYVKSIIIIILWQILWLILWNILKSNLFIFDKINLIDLLCWNYS